jgi:predicted transcriptional regulator
VGRAPEGRGHRYFAAVKQRVAQKSALQHLTRKLFKGSTELLFVHLVSDQKLSEKQISNMRKLLESKSDTGET